MSEEAEKLADEIKELSVEVASEQAKMCILLFPCGSVMI